MTTTEPAATHLILVRHGQSLYNRDGPNAGENSGLTELGWRQAQWVADWLAQTYRADALVTSPLTRARQTAEVIGHRLRLPVVAQPGLEETTQNYWDELVPPSADPLATWETPWQPTPQRAPIYTAFRARVRAGLAPILATYAGKTVIVVTHGGTIGTIVRSLFGGHQVSVHTENTGVTQLTWQEGRWRLILHNSQAHLTPPGLPPAALQAAGRREPFPWVESQQLQAVVAHFQQVANALPPEPALPTEKELQALVALAAPRPDARVLDAGTGAGAVALAFASHVASVVGIDVSPAMLERAERARMARNAQNVHFRWAEAGELPFTEHSFDLVTMRDLVHYLAAPEEVLPGLHRVLAPGGRLLLDEIVGSDDPVKRATQETIEVRRDPAFRKVYNAQEIERLVNAAGLRILKSERYAIARELEEWLAYAAADETTRAAVRAMFEAGLDWDAAGLHARRNRNGTLTFAQHRLRLLAEANVKRE